MTLMSNALALGALLPLSLAACASDAVPPSGGADAPKVADGAEFTLAPGQSATLADDSRLRYLRVVNDSRCPPNVQCVWAGDAVVAFEWTPASGPAQPFELHTGKEPRSHAAGGRTIALKTLARGEAPAATLTVSGGG